MERSTAKYQTTNKHMPKISTPILNETTTEDLIPKLKELGEVARMIKKHYPSTWDALVSQYSLECFPKVLSDKLFTNKLEISLLQDDELRNRR